ncbi:hypothetical protein HLB23_05245 [Nocardia uniformis]|uniref:Uncharacterized protein n=1 Tax=Nocardia uniformis TaxID=53432 RepID=A0A849C8J7_9NOCA|nr:hypothetical protein [Nocardia uniformis]NNH69281.1 hypothetical protein [Nocardia uniformis]
MTAVSSDPDHIVTRLLDSPEPSIRWLMHTRVLGTAPGTPAVRTIRESIVTSPRVRSLLSERRTDGTLPFHPYNATWYGAHWVLVALAELGYPAGDESLIPLREQALGWLLSREYSTHYVGRVRGLTTLHASIDANLLWALLSLGLADERTDQLLTRLLAAQWPDGGWNCDRHANGRVSSFYESLVPLRALALHARVAGREDSRAAVVRAAELFKSRHLFRRISDGTVMAESFLQLHFPCYYHYDILFALTVLTEAGLADDPRCTEALDLLEAKRLPDGGFPAEARFYQVRKAPTGTGRSLVGWGPTSRSRSNPWVTCAALAVLAQTPALGRPFVAP